MHLFHLSRLTRVVAILSAATLLMSAAGVANASSSTQVIVSVTGATTNVGPGGFWLWSQPGGNAYGNDGAGSIYFYAVLPNSQAADVSNVVVNGSGVGATVSEDVTAPKVHWSCHIDATETSPGMGSINFSCSNPSVSSTTVKGQVNIS